MTLICGFPKVDILSWLIFHEFKSCKNTWKTNKEILEQKTTLFVFNLLMKMVLLQSHAHRFTQKKMLILVKDTSDSLFARMRKWLERQERDSINDDLIVLFYLFKLLFDIYKIFSHRFLWIYEDFRLSYFSFKFEKLIIYFIS